ncbi:MAG: twin-arginine translocase subunit TatC [Bacteroidota bacterium]
MKFFGASKSDDTQLMTPQGGDGAAAPPQSSAPGDMAEMGFLDHLEEFRWSLIKGFAGILVATLACAFFYKWIIDALLLGPTKPEFFMYEVFGMEATKIDLLNRTITGQFFASIGIVVSVGIVIGSPIFVYSMWKFIEPGLYPEEKQGMRFAAAFATIFFVLGISFGYLVITPLALQFFNNYIISDQIVNEFDITRYFSMVTFWSFGLGVLFQMPVVIYFLSRAGIVNPEFLKRSRKYALIVVLVLGAFFTPPDPVSQVLVAMPLMLLYEFSIRLSAYTVRKRDEALAKALE